MTHFHGICHGNWALKYVGGTLEPRKLSFKRLRDQFDIDNANFRGLITNIGHYRPIFATRTIYDPFSWNMSWKLDPKACWRDSKAHKITFEGAQRPIQCQKAYFRGLIAKINRCWSMLPTRTHL